MQHSTHPVEYCAAGSRANASTASCVDGMKAEYALNCHILILVIYQNSTPKVPSTRIFTGLAKPEGLSAAVSPGRSNRPSTLDIQYSDRGATHMPQEPIADAQGCGPGLFQREEYWIPYCASVHAEMPVAFPQFLQQRQHCRSSIRTFADATRSDTCTQPHLLNAHASMLLTPKSDISGGLHAPCHSV